MKITSLTNPRIKQVVKLRHRKGREETGLTIVEGLREIQCARAAGVKFKEIYFCRDLLGQKAEKELAGILGQKSDTRGDVRAGMILEGVVPKSVALKGDVPRDIVLEETTRAVFEKISYGDRQEGVLGVAAPKPRDLSQIKLKAPALVVIVERAQKPGNLGAILRTGDAAGIDALIVCDGQTDIFNPNVIRASLGTVFSLPLVQTTNEKAFAFCKQNNISICAAIPFAAQIYSEADLKRSIAIAVGGEEEGLSKFWFKNADGKIRIPMRGKADSLNVSVSTAILVYEALRQRGKW